MGVRFLFEKEGALFLSVLVVPNSKVEKLVSFSALGLKVKLMALPVKGLANKSLIKFLAKKLRVAQKNIEIISGEGSKLKVVSIKEYTKKNFLKFREREGLG